MRTQNKYILIAAGLGYALLKPAMVVYAAVPTIQNPLKCANVIGCLKLVQSFMLTAITPIGVLATLYAGFLYLTAGGNQEKLAMAKRIILYVVLGSIIIGAAAGIQFLVTNILS
jgi:hypothetical protein